jgi:nucleoside-diphosphate-sugar epimerase
MKILITGGAGFIGSNLTQILLNQNHHITIIDNLITGSKKNINHLLNNTNLVFFQVDLVNFDFNHLSTFDLIYHLASPASPVKYKQYPIETLMVNSVGVKNLLDFMHKSKSRTLVLASTSEVYGNPLIHPQPETYWGNVNPNGIRSCYDEGKRFAESLAMTYFRLYHLDIRIARIFNTYGPKMEKNDGRVISNFIMQALTQQPITIYGNGKQTRSFCYVDDLVSGLIALGNTNHLAGEVINLGTRIEKTVNEIALLIKKLTRSNSLIINKPLEADDPQKRQPDISKAKKLLNWEPKIQLEDGLIYTINYFKKHYL